MATNEILSYPLPPDHQQAVAWTGLAGCADSLALASAINKENRLFVIVTPDNHTALRIEHELAFFLDGSQPILHFPDWETLPYDVFSPLPEIVSERLKTLAVLPQTKRGALVVSVNTLMHRLAPREHVLANSFSIKLGDAFNLELNRLKLESVGYQCVSQVYQHAEFAVRGAIVDIFPMGSKAPFRIELFDEEIESIRTFDPETQRSLDKIDQVQLFPAREFPVTDESIKHFRQTFRECFPNASLSNSLYQDVSKAIMPGGIEYYLPLFVEQTATLFDYLPAASVLVLPETFNNLAEAFNFEADERYQQRKYNTERPLLEPTQLFLSADALKQKTADFAQVTINHQIVETGDCLTLPDLAINAKLEQPAQKLQDFLKSFDGKLLFVAESAGRREGLIDKLRSFKITVKPVDGWQAFLAADSSPCITVAPMDHGLWLRPDRNQWPALALITENLLSGEKAQQRRRRRQSAARELDNIISNLNELSIGSPVVHQEHGVGRYLGLQTLAIGGIPAGFLTLNTPTATSFMCRCRRCI